MNPKRFEDLHRRALHLMWPGVVITLPSIGGIFYTAVYVEGSLRAAGLMLLFLLPCAFGWLLTALLGVPAALWSMHLERNSPLRLPSHAVARLFVAIAFLSILPILNDMIGLIRDIAS